MNIININAKFQKNPPVAGLRFKNRRKIPTHRLPFVDKDPNKLGLSFWAVPKTGGYYGGCETGSALARIYMKHLKDHGKSAGGMLQNIFIDMFDADKGSTPELDALHGQVVGFCWVLESWLAGGAKHLIGGLEAQDNKELLAIANEGINFDSDAYINSLSDKEEALA